jgi:hypothetical protein
LTKIRPRVDMLGFTFNYSRGDFLYSGEVARKSPRQFNDASFGLLEKTVIDTSLRVEYSLGKGGAHSVSLEAVNSHVQGWTPEVQGTPRNTNSLVRLEQHVLQRDADRQSAHRLHAALHQPAALAVPELQVERSRQPESRRVLPQRR